MSYHDPHPVVKIGVVSGDGRLGPNRDSFEDDHRTQSRVNWREGASVVGGILVLLITSWLIWAALAEAVIAAAETA